MAYSTSQIASGMIMADHRTEDGPVDKYKIASLFRWHIDVWTKWPPFHRRHFQMHFHKRKCLYLNSNLDWQQVSTGLGNGLALNKRQSIGYLNQWRSSLFTLISKDNAVVTPVVSNGVTAGWRLAIDTAFKLGTRFFLGCHTLHVYSFFALSYWGFS